MKLPGIGQGRVQGLGREDMNAPLRQGAVEVEASRQRVASVQQMTGAAQALHGKYAEAQEAAMAASQKAEAMKAVSTYKVAVEEGLANTQDFDEAGNPIWDNQEDKLHAIKRDAQAQAREGIITEQSSMMFEQAKANIDIETDALWENKVNTAVLKDAEATALNSMDDAHASGSWDIIEEITADPHMKQVLTPRAINKYKSIAKRGRMMDGYEAQRLQSVNDAEASLSLKQKALEDPNMNNADKASFIAAVNTGQINSEAKGFTDLLVMTEEEAGLAGSLMEADRVINMYLRMDAKTLGGDERFKSQVIDRLQGIRNDFASGLKRASNNHQNALKDQMILGGRIKVSPRKNAKDYNNMALRLSGGMFDEKGKYIEGSINEEELLDPTSVQSQTMVGLTKKFGFFPQHYERTLGTALLNGTDDQVADVIDVFAQVASNDPAKVFNNPETSFAKDLFALVQLSGQTQEGRDEALKLYRAKQALGESEKQMYKDQRYSSDYKKQVENSFNSALKEKFPVVNTFFSDSAPSVKQGMRNRIKALAGEYLPMAQGDTNRAVNMALETLKWEYGIRTTQNGKKELAHHPPGQMMAQETGLSPEQNDIWINRQMDFEVKEYLANEGGDPNYDTSYIEFVSTPDFDPKNPIWTLMDNNPKHGGMSIPLFTYKPVFEGTPEYAERRRIEEVRAVRANEKAKRTQQSIKWQQENPSLLVVKEPNLRRLADPYEGIFSNALIGMKQRAEDARRAMFGPLSTETSEYVGGANEEQL